MKGKKHLLNGLFFGMMIGWALGFLRLPYLEKNDSFLLGFIAALAIVSLTLILVTAWKRGFLPGLLGKKTVTEDAQKTRTHTVIWSILVGILVLGGVMGGLGVYRQIESSRLQIQNQEKKLQKMAALVEAVKKNDPAPLMRSILYDIGEELKRNPGRTLCDSTIARIAALSFSFTPYKYVEGDSLSEKACSPGRGQLLQALVLMKIDSGSFARIKENTRFAGADLRGASLNGSDLSGIDLQDANLKDAQLSGVNLKGADLGGANFWGANLNKANLSLTNLKKADLRWALLNEASLIMTNLNGANLANAQLIKADLSGTTVRWAQSGGALFNEANLTKVSFVGTNLTKAALRQANLSNTDFRLVHLSEADLVGVLMDSTLVDGDWLEKLKEWRPAGAKALQEIYTIKNDTAKLDKRILYRLIKI
ncbi:MAG: pentapeptide repeat-containing protein [Saprospiraceae bacterium]|nr:pentapeptide repeat-containing protein [Saprospiraceae bacterium]